MAPLASRVSYALVKGYITPDRSGTAHKRAIAMIKLTRLNGEVFILNADLIRYVESRPDTFVTLTTGERVVVAETMDEVMMRAIGYQQAKHLIPAPKRPGDEASRSQEGNR